MAKLPLLETISAGGLCTGCGLCQSVTGGKAKMAFNQHGFLRPVLLQPLTPADDTLVRAVCPGLGLTHARETASYHPLWGPLVAVRTGYALDPALRHGGSSGGAISGLLSYLLESGKVDYVLHIGASLSEPLINEIKLSHNRAEVLANAGSRYAPSAPLTGIDALLARPGRFAFVGKPCDVAALRKYAQHNPQVNEKVPYMLSFMCAGVPSMKGTVAILKRFDVQPDEVRSFAYRGNGWPGMTRVETHAGAVHETDYATSWGTVLNRHLQARCKICPDGIGEFADVVCADAWYGKDGYPDFAEQEGRSLVISRTGQGEQLLAEATAAGYLSVAPLDVDEIRKMQPYQENRKQMVLARVLALRLMGRPAPAYHRLRLQRTAWMGGLKANAKNFLGMVKRLALNRQPSGM
ncbi:coenzyme F420 hydrogenase subunit beta [Duganella sacchari]|uniref:Coenzyme F420 hydrogenase subunit beta n=1 Tax=Duganella sacchari TaxID=551987 RepID=A0A1M7R0L9_9BURK|nr:Coenzyme F420 hydrogenase/dehydrogenase, beta subunit C-terminal domain [Duganella sacchari]SHN38048.1 coenzyme F420 hydrogenase subunit beta [Duganella sacchari]